VQRSIQAVRLNAVWTKRHVLLCLHCFVDPDRRKLESSARESIELLNKLQRQFWPTAERAEA
jgi:hypothetical protein